MRHSGVLILQNITREGPGLIEEVLLKHQTPFDLVDLHRGAEIPELTRYRALVVLGGSDSANDASKKILAELECIREWLTLERPYLGICLGLQLLVKAAGGAVVKSPVKETGFIGPDGKPFRMTLTEQGVKDPLFAGLETSLEVFQLHGEKVELPAGAVLLGEGDFCREQAVRVGRNAYGIQCHVEVTRPLLEAWAGQDDDLRQLQKESLLNHYDRIRENYLAAGRKVVENFLQISRRKEGVQP